MLFILEEGGNCDFESFGDVSKVAEISVGLCLFEKNDEIVCLRQITSQLWKLAFTDKYTFDNETPDFPHKDYFFYKYKVWGELQKETLSLDTSSFYKC